MPVNIRHLQGLSFHQNHQPDGKLKVLHQSLDGKCAVSLPRFKRLVKAAGITPGSLETMYVQERVVWVEDAVAKVEKINQRVNQLPDCMVDEEGIEQYIITSRTTLDQVDAMDKTQLSDWYSSCLARLYPQGAH